ncbi:MAG: hypothetical protein IJ385_03955 [Ruminiclostridium sp.]|nr:hypothetical protein [Ruminiclostridium sp.]
MIDYKPLYYFLYNGITDIINEMEENGEESMYTQHLKFLQISAEELYLQQEDEKEN